MISAGLWRRVPCSCVTPGRLDGLVAQFGCTDASGREDFDPPVRRFDQFTQAIDSLQGGRCTAGGQHAEPIPTVDQLFQGRDGRPPDQRDGILGCGLHIARQFAGCISHSIRRRSLRHHRPVQRSQFRACRAYSLSASCWSVSSRKKRIARTQHGNNRVRNPRFEPATSGQGGGQSVETQVQFISMRVAPDAWAARPADGCSIQASISIFGFNGELVLSKDENLAVPFMV